MPAIPLKIAKTSAIVPANESLVPIRLPAEGAGPVPHGGGSRDALAAASAPSDMLPTVAPDGRWSPVAAATVRGVCRMFARHGMATVTEMPLASGRRADIVALAGDGTLIVVEVKSSLEDLRCDRKWPEYRAHCDRLYFAAPPEMPLPVFPDDAGLIVADAYGAEFIRHDPSERRLAAATRKTMLIRFGRMAAARYHRACDPEAVMDPFA